MKDSSWRLSLDLLAENRVSHHLDLACPTIKSFLVFCAPKMPIHGIMGSLLAGRNVYELVGGCGALLLGDAEVLARFTQLSLALLVK